MQFKAREKKKRPNAGVVDDDDAGDKADTANIVRIDQKKVQTDVCTRCT